MRLLAFALAVIAMLFIGRAIYEILLFSILPWMALLLGIVCAVAATILFRRARAGERV